MIQQNLAPAWPSWPRRTGSGSCSRRCCPSPTTSATQTGSRSRARKGRPTATLHALNDWIADYARREGHVYLDYAKAVGDAAFVLKPELNDDGLHPNTAGYAVMAPLAEEAIARALGKR